MNFYTKPFRACDAEFEKLKFPVMAFPKIDGVRGVKFGDTFTGRTLKQFANRYVRQVFSHPAFTGFDGELIAGTNPIENELCGKTTSALNTVAGTPVINWWLFDYVTPETLYLPYKTRYEMLLPRLGLIEAEFPALRQFLSIVPWRFAANQTELDIIIQDMLEEGYEGTVLRTPRGLHKEGYCTAREANFVRIKDFTDAEAIITGFRPVMGNANEARINALGQTERSSHKENKWEKDQIGSLLCQTFDGKDIVVSAGSLTHEEKTYYYHNFGEILNKIITYKTMKYGSKDKPRFPTLKVDRSLPTAHSFKAFRADLL